MQYPLWKADVWPPDDPEKSVYVGPHFRRPPGRLKWRNRVKNDRAEPKPSPVVVLPKPVRA